MTKLKVTTIVGTRPEIIRMSEIIKKFDTFFEHRLIHTGQNPDPLLKDIFFKDLEIEYNVNSNMFLFILHLKITCIIKRRKTN
jgi:UDP-N-acetylglucosamine 2-epimerase